MHFCGLNLYNIVHFYFPLFVHFNIDIYIWVENPIETARKSLPKQRETAEKVEIPGFAFGKSLPKQRKSAEKVENPSATARKSLPKQRKNRERGRDS